MAAPTLVTLVHTDIQDSTRLWERAEAAMRLALPQHDAILRAQLATCDGYEVRTEGDAFLVAFEKADQALEFCLGVQEALAEAEWPEALLDQENAQIEVDGEGRRLWCGLRVRMGVHSAWAEASADATTDRRSYSGPIVHRCLAIASAAHGGQIVTTQALWNGLDKPRGEHLELGIHRLPDRSEAIDLVQVYSAKLRARSFPDLRSLSPERSNLNEPKDATVGRRQDIENVKDALMAGQRCLAMVGPAGVGKSRIARAAALATTHAFRSGAWCIDLASCKDEDSFLHAVASTLAIPLNQAENELQIATLARAIANRGRMLLLLDNCDRVDAPIAAIIPEWLDASPSLFVILTSRRVPALKQTTLLRTEPMSQTEGVELFLKRADERRAKLRLDDNEREACATIVRELDGLPLAIELAASRVGILTPSRIAERLNQRFRLLQKRSRDDDRQATLSAALDWSWQTLTSEQQNCLAGLSIFRNGFDLQAAASVVGEPLENMQISLTELLDQSMVWVPQSNRGERYQLLESIRLFAADQLEKSGRTRIFAAAHARYFGHLGQQLYARSQTADLLDALERVRTDRANLLAAFEQSVGEAPEHAAGAALGLVPLLFTQGPVALGNSLFLKLAPEAERMGSATRAVFLTLLARVRISQGEQELSLQAIRAARRAADEGDDMGVVAMVIETHVRVLNRSGDLSAAKEKVREGLALVRKHQTPIQEARLHAAIGNLYYRMGKVDVALQAFEHSARGFDELGMDYNEAQSLGNAGLIHLANRRFDRAEECFLVCLRQYEEMRNLGEQALVHGYLGLLAMDRGDLDRAERHYQESVATGRRIAKDEPVTVGLGYLGVVAQFRGQTDQSLIRYEEALRSVGAGSSQRIEIYFRCYHAGLLSRLGHDDEAKATFARCRRLLEQVQDPFAASFIELTEAQGWCAFPKNSERLRALVESMTKAEDGSQSPYECNEDIRFALRLLEAR
jgi:predicted ATPase/class 3 adenylate cyclase